MREIHVVESLVPNDVLGASRQKALDFSRANEAYVKYRTSASGRTKLVFEALKSVNNPKSIHGLYPYRGKISALDARQVLSQLPSSLTLLDPFCGSGTILHEGQKLGMDVIGVDNNPIAYSLSQAKLEQKSREDYIAEVTTLLQAAKWSLEKNCVPAMPEGPARHFHEQSANEVMSVSLFREQMSAYVKGCYYGAIALTARGCNHYRWTSSSVGKNIEPKQYISFYEKLEEKVKKHYAANCGQPTGRVILGDARQLSQLVEPGSVDVVFTSPPYFDALDYTAYYGKIIYEIHEENRLEIKEGLIQRFADYSANMERVLEEINRVTRQDALIIFVVGDKKAKDGTIDGGQFFASLREKQPAYIVERVYSGSQSQIFDTLNRTRRKEQIVVWDKSIGF